MEYLVLYLCSIADSVHILLMVLGIIGVFLSLAIFLMSICSSQCESCSYSVCTAKGVKQAGIKVKHIVVPTFIIMMLAVLTPSTNKCYAIFGIGATLHYVNNSKEAKKVPDNAMKAINCYLGSLAHNDSIQ